MVASQKRWLAWLHAIVDAIVGICLLVSPRSPPSGCPDRCDGREDRLNTFVHLRVVQCGARKLDVAPGSYKCGTLKVWGVGTRSPVRVPLPPCSTAQGAAVVLSHAECV